MKKQRKQLIVMAFFLGVLLVAYAGLGIYNERQEEQESEENTVLITDFNYEDVVAFSYNYDDVTYQFTKSDSSWNLEGKADFDVDESIVESMLAVAGSLLGVDYYDAYESLDNYGLDEPQQVVSLTFADGSTTKLQFGNYNDIVGYYYLMVEGDSNLYIVDSALLDTFAVSYTSLEYIEEETQEGTEALTEE